MDKKYIDLLEAELQAGVLYDLGGSYGHLIVNQLGHIVGWKDHNGWCKACPKEYSMIRLFDMKCYLRHSTEQYADITELSDWDRNGEFTPFCKQTRKHVKRGDVHI